MEDQKLACLTMADKYWRQSFYADKAIKLEYAKELHQFAFLSLTQLAKIVRVRTVDLTRDGLKTNSKGGRFEPETLTALISMRKSKLLGERIPKRLLEICVKGGTSWSCASSLTGIPFTTYYADVPDIDTRNKRELKVTPKDREAIVKAVRAGANKELLAEQYRISAHYVWRIVSSHEDI